MRTVQMPQKVLSERDAKEEKDVSCCLYVQVLELGEELSRVNENNEHLHAQIADYHGKFDEP